MVKTERKLVVNHGVLGVDLNPPCPVCDDSYTDCIRVEGIDVYIHAPDDEEGDDVDTSLHVCVADGDEERKLDDRKIHAALREYRSTDQPAGWLSM